MGFLTTVIIGAAIGAVAKWQYDENLGSMADMRLKLNNAEARIGHLQGQQKEAAKLREELSAAKSKLSELEN